MLAESHPIPPVSLLLVGLDLGTDFTITLIVEP